MCCVTYTAFMLSNRKPDLLAASMWIGRQIPPLIFLSKNTSFCNKFTTSKNHRLKKQNLNFFVLVLFFVFKLSKKWPNLAIYHNDHMTHQILGLIDTVFYFVFLSFNSSNSRYSSISKVTKCRLKIGDKTRVAVATSQLVILSSPIISNEISRSVVFKTRIIARYWLNFMSESPCSILWYVRLLIPARSAISCCDNPAYNRRTFSASIIGSCDIAHLISDSSVTSLQESDHFVLAYWRCFLCG